MKLKTPSCPVCGARPKMKAPNHMSVVSVPAGIMNITWTHESWCSVPDDPAARSELMLKLIYASESGGEANGAE